MVTNNQRPQRFLCDLRALVTFVIGPSARWLLLPAALRERPVVMLHQLAVLLRDVVGPREEDLAGVGVEAAPKRVLEALDVVGHRLLQARERLGVGVRAFVVELAQPFEDLVELLRVDLLDLQELLQLPGGRRALARLGAELTHLLAREAAHRARVAERSALRVRRWGALGALRVTLAVASALRGIALVPAAVPTLAAALGRLSLLALTLSLPLLTLPALLALPPLLSLLLTLFATASLLALVAHALAERLHALRELPRLVERLRARVGLRVSDGARGLADLLLQIVQRVLDVAAERRHVRRLAAAPPPPVPGADL